MLLGCCHCGETPSESIPSDSRSIDNPSESVTSSESVSYGIAGCNACDGDVLPTRYTIASTKSAGTLFTGCNAQYTGSFQVFHTPDGLTPLPSAGSPAYSDIGGTTCRFFGVELTLKLNDATCEETTNLSGRRFTLAIVRTDLGGSFRYEMTVTIQWWEKFGSGSPQAGTMNYTLTQDDIATPGDNAFNCLGTFVLPRTSGTRSLLQTGFPSSVTVTPG